MFQTPPGNRKKGLLVIEILIIVGIIATALAGLLSLTALSIKAGVHIKHSERANNILQETLEATRNFRDGTNWNVDGLGTLQNDFNYFPQNSGWPPKWQMVQGTETIDIYQRKVIFQSVQRDANDNIVQSGGVADPNSRKVTARVSWQERGQNYTLELSTYLTNWRK